MKHIMAIFGLLFFPVMVFADFSANNWRFIKKMEQVENPVFSQKLATFILDRQVYASAKKDLSDVRIVDATGEEVPYHIIDIGRAEAIRQVPIAMLNNSFVEGKEQSFVLDFGEKKVAHSQVVLDINDRDRNFRRKVTVSGSDVIGEWKILSKDNIIYDYSIDVFARKTALYYPLTNFRYVFVEIENPGAQPLGIAGAKGSFIISSGTQNFTSEVRYDGMLSVIENNENRATEAVIDMRQNNIPIHKIIIETSSVDFYRQVKVYGRSNEGDAWRPYVTDVIFHYSDPMFQGSQLTIYSPEISERFIKIVVINNDNKPIAVSGVQLYGNAKTVVFPFSARNTYFLYYGNAVAQMPQYDLAHILARMKIEEYTTALKLGEESANSFYRKPEKPLPPFTERNPYLLNTLLSILVLLIGGMTIRVLVRNQKK